MSREARQLPRGARLASSYDAALAVIVGAQDQNCVFERDDQEERPEDQRHDAHHCVGGGRPGRLDGLLQPIERAGADIAVDNTECGKRHGWGLLPDTLPGQPRGLKGLGHPDILPCARPKLAVYTQLTRIGNPTLPAPSIEDIVSETRQTYQGPLQVGEDLMC